MACSKDHNIIHGDTIPDYLLNSKINLSQFFVQLLGNHGNKTAMIDVHDGTSFTFANVLHASFNIADWLRFECGIKKSDVVGIFSENSVWYSSLVLASWHIGAMCALINPLYNKKELTHVLNLSKPKVIITSKMGLEVVRDTSRQLHFIKHVVPIDTIFSPKTLEKNPSFVPVSYDNSETCVILFSSGTTGLPKAVELSHRSLYLLINILNINHDPFVTNSDILMGIVPMFHGSGVFVLWVGLSAGGKIIIHKYFNEELFLKSIELHKITVLFVVPPLMIFLAKHPLVDEYDLSSLNVIYTGAAPLPKEIGCQVTSRIGKEKSLPVLQIYGMTELCIVVTYQSKTSIEFSYGCVGNLVPGMLGKVIDLCTGKPLPENQTGELCFKGPLSMKGYHANPYETSLIIDSEGWLHTGDVGYYSKNNFYIVDRIKELIKYKGYQVAPAELESLLLTHPEIDDAAVIGLPNLQSGELPMAFIVKSSKSTLSEKDVIAFVHKHMSPQKRLRGGVQFVDRIPKNPSGKILRRVLKSLLKQTKL